MSEKEATDQQITDTLNKIMDTHPDRSIQLLAKILFNCRYDINELKLELLKVFKPEGEDKDLEDIINGSFYS